jgi:hypothetical protein
MDSEQLGWIVAAMAVPVVIAFFLMVYNVAAIRRMVENVGLFSGVACRWCRMAVPAGAEVCGHCGRELGVEGGAP